MTSASAELIKGKDYTDLTIANSKQSNWLSSDLRKLGYELACREIYGENCQEYFELKQKHWTLLQKLYKLQKRIS